MGSRRAQRRIQARPRLSPLAGPQRRDRERGPQRSEQIAPEHVARHVPREDQQRTAHSRGEHHAQHRDGSPACGGSDEQHTPRERRRSGRVTARPRGVINVQRDDLRVGMSDQRLEQLGAARPEGQHERHDERDPRTPLRDGEHCEHDPPHGKEPRFEQGEQHIRGDFDERTIKPGEVV